MAETVGTVVVDDVEDVDVSVVVVPLVPLRGLGAPVEKRQPAPGALKAVMFTYGGGRFVNGVVGPVVVGVEIDVDVALVVVGPEGEVVEVARCVVVVLAAGVRCSFFS
jgi:hypothetical protein